MWVLFDYVGVAALVADGVKGLALVDNVDLITDLVEELSMDGIFRERVFFEGAEQDEGEEDKGTVPRSCISYFYGSYHGFLSGTCHREREGERGWFEGKLWPFLWVRFEKMGRWSWGRGRVTYVDVFIMVKLQKGPLSSLLCNFLIWWKFSGLGSLLKHLTEVPSATACLSLSLNSSSISQQGLGPMKGPSRVER